jgi:hypothetical protein
MSSMPLLHISTTLHPVASPLKPKSMYWIHTTVAGHPLQTVQLPSSTAIKRLSQSWSLSPPLNRHYFAFSLARTSHHRSSTHYHRSLSPPFHVHHSSAQWHPRQHPRWQTSRLSFAFWIAYRHINSRKYKIF